jgi:hypothetical protein
MAKSAKAPALPPATVADRRYSPERDGTKEQANQRGCEKTYRLKQEIEAIKNRGPAWSSM